MENTNLLLNKESREIVFDTETTGLKPEDGEKIVEIAAVELINHVPTGKTYHQYINPHHRVSEKAFEIHGLSEEFLEDKPSFAEIAQDWIDFVGDAKLIAHNANFDMKFINNELKQAEYKEYEPARFIDTLKMARALFPQQKNDLDTLCKRYHIDNSSRTIHGALIDTQLLAQIYLKLLYTEQIKQAIAESKKLKITYWSNPDYKNEITTRIIVPQYLAFGRDFKKDKNRPLDDKYDLFKFLRDDSLYLQAFCELRQADRTFMVGRIQKLEILD
ncbi:MAG: DNA polymerase III subunit epsilon [Alphaproteobacteria bacterium]|nr:DNA polymerase III subunit epsilon [Alphaproteobacteria bacterium]